jgi:DNA-directed RNA polymerase subunit RPC12/RpoP
MTTRSYHCLECSRPFEVSGEAHVLYECGDCQTRHELLVGHGGGQTLCMWLPTERERAAAVAEAQEIMQRHG